MSVATDLTTHVVGFCRALRARGLTVGPREASDALCALAAVGVADRRECYLALRAVLTSCFDDLSIFDQVLDEYWPPPAEAASRETAAPQPLPAAAGDGLTQTPSPLSWLDE